MVQTRSGAVTPPPAAKGGSANKRRALVTGGAGFLGRHIIDALLASGGYDVSVLDVRPLDDPRVSSVVADLRNPDQVAAAVLAAGDGKLRGPDVVFHCATAAPSGENATHKALMHSVNVDGTRNVIDACVKLGVPSLVYTSSASVVFDGQALHNADESAPYARKPMDYYTGTKIEGEKLALAANGTPLQGGGKLATVALRPSGIFGEHDALFVPTVVRNAVRGKMKFIIGTGANRMDWTYAGNVAQAHLQAADALYSSGSGAAPAGRPYFVTNHDPKPFWGMMGDVCEGLGYARPSVKLPAALLIAVAFIFELLILPLLRLIKPVQLDFTVNRMLIASRERTFSPAAATRDLGYVPKVSMEVAMQRTLAFFQHLRAEKMLPQARSGGDNKAQPGGAAKKSE